MQELLTFFVAQRNHSVVDNSYLIQTLLHHKATLILFCKDWSVSFFSSIGLIRTCNGLFHLISIQECGCKIPGLLRKKRIVCGKSVNSNFPGHELVLSESSSWPKWGNPKIILKQRKYPLPNFGVYFRIALLKSYLHSSHPSRRRKFYAKGIFFLTFSPGGAFELFANFLHPSHCMIIFLE